MNISLDYLNTKTMSDLELQYRKLIENIIESEISEEFKHWIKWRLMKIEAPEPIEDKEPDTAFFFNNH